MRKPSSAKSADWVACLGQNLMAALAGEGGRWDSSGSKHSAAPALQKLRPFTSRSRAHCVVKQVARSAQV